MPTHFSLADTAPYADPAYLTVDPSAPTAHPETRSHTPIHALLAAMGAGQVADALTTRSAIERGGTETNPILGSDPSLLKLLGLKAAVGIPAGYALDRAYNTHPKLSMALAGLATAAGVGAAIHNSRVNRK